MMMLISYLFPPFTELEFLKLTLEFMYCNQLLLQFSKARLTAIKQLSQGHTSGKQSILPEFRPSDS